MEDPDILVDLMTAGSEFEAQTIAQALEAHGVSAKVFANAGSTLQGVIANDSIKVAVRRADLELARSILRTVKADSVDLDWSEVDTGDRSPLSDRELSELRAMKCPVCGHDLAGLDRDAKCPECGMDLRSRLPRVRSTGRPSSGTARSRGIWAAVLMGVGIGIVALPGSLGMDNAQAHRALTIFGAGLILIAFILTGLIASEKRPAAKR